MTFAPDTTSRRGSTAGLGIGTGGGGSGGSSTTNLVAPATDFSPGFSSPLAPSPTTTDSAPGSAVPRISLDMAPLRPDSPHGPSGLGRRSMDTTRTT